MIPTLVEWMLSVKWEMIIQETQDQFVLVRKFIFKVYPVLSYYDTFSCIADTLNMKTDNVTHSDARISIITKCGTLHIPIAGVATGAMLWSAADEENVSLTASVRTIGHVSTTSARTRARAPPPPVESTPTVGW